MVISINCTSCLNTFKTSENALSLMGGRARCPECGHVMHVDDKAEPQNTQLNHFKNPLIVNMRATQDSAKKGKASRTTNRVFEEAFFEEEVSVAGHESWLKDLAGKIEPAPTVAPHIVTNSKLSLGEPIIGSNTGWGSLSDNQIMSYTSGKLGQISDDRVDDEAWLAELVSEVNTQSHESRLNKSLVSSPTNSKMNVFSSLSHAQGTTDQESLSGPIEAKTPSMELSARHTRMMRVAQTDAKPSYVKKAALRQRSLWQELVNFAVIILMLGGLLLQYYAFNQHRLSGTTIGQAMQMVAFKLAGREMVEPNSLSIDAVRIKKGAEPQSYIVEARIKNKAEYSVPLPSVKLVLPKNVGASMVPSQYLAPSVSGLRSMLADSSLPIAFKVSGVDGVNVNHMQFVFAKTYANQ